MMTIKTIPFLLTKLLFLLGLSYPAFAGEEGQLTREVWNNIKGSKVSDLTELPAFHGGADLIELVDSAAVPNYNGNEYGSRLRGSFTAPVSGEYLFWVSGDDAAELWLSSDGSKFNTNLIAHHKFRTDPLQWDRFEEQQSEPIQLLGGQKYYFEALQKEGIYEDHLAVAWQYRETRDSVNLTQLPGVTASQSTRQWSRYAEHAIDGLTGGKVWEGDLISQTTDTPGSWWQVDLGSVRSLDEIVLWNQQGELGVRLTDFRVSVLDESGVVLISKDFHRDGTFAGQRTQWRIPGAINGQTVRVEKLGPSSDGTHFLILAEVEVFGRELTEPMVEENLTQLPGVAARQSQRLWSRFANHAIDGNTGGATWKGDLLSSTVDQPGSWWEVDLGSDQIINRISVWNEESSQGESLANFRIRLLRSDGTVADEDVFFTDGSHAPNGFSWQTNLDGTVGNQFDWVLAQPAYARTVRIEKIGPGAGGRDLLTLAEVEVHGFANQLLERDRQVIAPECLESYDIDPLDLDDDNLYDAWEQAHGFDITTWQDGDYAFLADPDGDFMVNGDESLFGNDPFVAEQFPGLLTVERWRAINYNSLREALTQEDRLYQRADEEGFIAGSSTGLAEDRFYHQRIRGYLEAPESGYYRFWLSARYGAQLYLSTGAQKYHKTLIAELGPEVGTATGVPFTEELRWDWFVSQMSQEVYLEAGQQYFLEILNQHGHWAAGAHASLAWARPGGEREPVPAEMLSSYHQIPEDADDDSLPDPWETAMGLDATDNGLLNREQQGERGDFDADGLTNREEYLLGTDPTLADTDGDGISDFDEHRAYGTDPTISDVTPEQVVHTIALTSETGFGEDWIQTGSGGLLATSFRGGGTWNFTTPSHGHWVIQMSAKLRGDLRYEEKLPIIASVNGHQIERRPVLFRGDVSGTLRILTPWLPAGQHDFELFIDNNTIRRSLEINAIQVLTPGGTDLDGSGLPDWADLELANRSRAFAGEQLSHISPAFIEGLSPAGSLVDLTTITRSGQSNRQRRYTAQQVQRMLTSFELRVQRSARRLQTSMRRRQINPNRYQNDGRGSRTLQSHAEGPGTKRWLSKISLNPNEAIGYVAQFENLGTYDTGTIAWVPVNVLDATPTILTIPVGSKLLFGAWVKKWDHKNVTVTVDGHTYSFKARKTKIHQFSTAGTYVMTATHQNGATGTLTIEVKEAILPDHLAVGEERFFETDLPGVTPDLAFDTNGEVPHDGLTAVSTGSTTKLAGATPGVYRAAASLTPAQTGGRSTILSQTNTYVTGVSDALRNDSDLYSPLDEDLFLVRSPLLVMHLPPGATMEAVIFAGGVTFPDGTTTKTLTEADLDENGVYTFEFYMPRERLGAPCHYTNIYNDQGQRIWGSNN